MKTDIVQITKEDLASVVASSIVGYIAGVFKFALPKETAESLKETTLESIEEGDGFLEEMKDLDLVHAVSSAIVRGEIKA